MKRHYPLFLIVAIVLLIRLPFLNQAIQGDDPYYIYGAQHALIDPAHPTHARYLFQGVLVDMRGHPHPPLNAWTLAALIWLFGDVYEVPFHAAYLVFSLIAALAMYSLARRFTDHPLGATLIFLAVPAFVVNGNSFESDIPFLAFWMAGMAFFVAQRFALAAAALTLAALSAYQAIVATPILWIYCWFHLRRSRSAWLTALAPCITVAVFQIYERLTSGALPAAVLAGYFSTYGLQQFANKLKNAVALTAHTGWMAAPFLTAWAFRSRWYVAVAAALAGVFLDPHPLFWISFAIGAMAIAWCIRKPDFLTSWILIFFAASLVLFFAGSARYLLPMAAPLAILVSRERRLVVPAFVTNLALGLALAFVNYQTWDGYRQFTASLADEIAQKRVWINGELGMRHYLESAGALPLPKGRALQTGEWVITSELAFSEVVTAPLGRVSTLEIRPSLPLRIFGLGAKSGYSTAALGFRPFDIYGGPVDRVRAEAVLERKPTLSYLPMNAPEAQTQIVSGLYAVEDGQWRWTAGRAIVLLKPPSAAAPLHAKLFIPGMAPARGLRILVDGQQVHEQTFPGPGQYSIVTPTPLSGTAVTLLIDKTFNVGGDGRALGVILSEIGFR